MRQILRQAGAPLWHRRPRPVILMYHRVATVLYDPWELAISRKRFGEQIAHLNQHRTVMVLRDLVKGVRSGSLPADAVAITFDDGYRDNLVNALPILVRHGTPATVFVATGYTGSKEPFWWDELAAMILASPEPVAQTHLFQGGSVGLEWGAPERSDRPGQWRAWKKPSTERQKCYLALWRRLHDARLEEREEVMNLLRQRLYAERDAVAMPMKESELREVTSGGLVELGAHTVTHSSLPLLDKVARRRELSESRMMCRAFAPRCAVDNFAYPFGDADSAVCDDVADMGYSGACSTRPGFLDEEPLDLYLLPRIAVRNAPIRAFIEQITA